MNEKNSMSIAVLFPRLIAQARELGISDERIKLLSGVSVGFDIIASTALLIGEAEAAAQAVGFDHLLALDEDVVRDIHESRREQSGLDAADWDFLRLFVSVAPLTLAIGRGEFGVAFDWVVRGIADLVVINQSIDHEDLRPSVLDGISKSRREFIRQNKNGTIARWAAGAFYYSRTQNVLAEILDVVLPVTSSAIMTVFAEDSETEPVLYLLGWLDKYHPNEAEKLAERLALIALDEHIESACRMRLAVGLAARHHPTAKRGREEWAALALASGDRLHQHVQAQLLSIVLAAGEEINETTLNALIDACASAEAQRRREFDASHLGGVRGRLFSVLEPALAKLARRARVRDVIRVLRAWRGVEGDVRSDVALVLPLCEDHASFVTEGAFVPTDEEGESCAFAALVAATNKALGLLLIRTDVEDASVDPVERLGVPSRADAERFERTADGWLAAGRLKEKVSALVPLGVSKLPLQAIQLRSAGWTAPISLSLSPPLPHARPRRVVFWKSADVMYAEEEKEVVAAAFKTSGVEVIVVEGEARTPARFIDAYDDPATDILWVSGHAELHVYRPQLSFLDLGNGQQLAVADLAGLAIPKRESRRLLMLNVCDGASSAVHSGPAETGIGVALACPSQVVCSHLWPVELLPSAAFGAVFALSLQRADSVLEAYSNAMNVVRRGPDDVVDELRAFDGSLALIERIERNKAPFQPWTILDWGSAALFE